MSDVNSNPAPEWYGDPTGRADYRYWDGGAWSTWVASGGSSRVDDEPLAPDIPPPPPVLPPGIPMPPRVRVAYGRSSYASLKGLSVALTWLAGFEVLVCLVRLGTLVNALVKLDDFDDFSTFSRYDEWRDAHYAAGSAMGWILILAVPVFVLFIILMYRASTNTLLWTGDHPRWAAGWTIGGWFIPLAWFVIPFLVMREIWRRSTPPGVKPGTSRVVWWWVLFTLGFVASLGVGPDTLSEYRAQYSVNIVGSVLLVVAAVLFVAMVRELERRQRSLSRGTPSQ